MSQNSGVLPELLTLIQQATHNFTMQELPNKVVLLMGSSKAGKTTLLYYLLGKKLNLVVNELGVSVLQPEAIYHYAYIGDGYESTTVYPNIPTDCGVEGVIIVDMPGFDDTRPMYKLINFYILMEMLKMVEEVHICQVIEQLFIESDQFQNLIQKICALINQNVLRTDRALSFVITKVEDQECIEKLEANLQTLISQNQNGIYIHQFSAFLKDKKYMFKNEKPKLKEGIELKQKILKQNVFVKIEKKPEKFLSHSFCDYMIGETNLKQFHNYLSQLLLESESTILQLIRLFFAMNRYEYSETIALFEDLTVEQIRKCSFQDLKTLKQPLFVNKINKIQVPQVENFQVSLESHQKLIKIIRSADQYSLVEWIQCLACHFKDSQSLIFPKELIEALYYTFKEFYTLLRILISINNQFKQIIGKLLNCSTIKEQIFQFAKFWHQHTLKLQDKSDLPQATDEFYQIYCTQLNINPITQVKEEIVYIFKYKQIKNKQVKQLMKTPHQNQNHKQVKKIKKLNFTLQQIQKLPLNTSVLEHILEIIPTLDKKDFLEAVLVKAGEIFTHFSFYEEAIMFAMVVANHKKITELVQDGLYQDCSLSALFIRQILIKYLINTEWPYHRQICICYNYLASIAQTREQFIQFQLEYFDYIQNYSLGKTNLRENIENKDEVELFFIEPILKQKQKYISLLKLIEKKFRESQCTALLASSAISQIMK